MRRRRLYCFPKLENARFIFNSSLNKELRFFGTRQELKTILREELLKRAFSRCIFRFMLNIKNSSFKQIQDDFDLIAEIAIDLNTDKITIDSLHKAAYLINELKPFLNESEEIFKKKRMGYATKAAKEVYKGRNEIKRLELEKLKVAMFKNRVSCESGKILS